MGNKGGRGIPQSLEGFGIAPRTSSRHDNVLSPSDLQSDVPMDMIYSSDQGKVTMDDFDLLKVIGRGNFAKVMQVRKKDSGKVLSCSYSNSI
jgi:hypothetical protein